MRSNCFAETMPCGWTTMHCSWLQKIFTMVLSGPNGMSDYGREIMTHLKNGVRTSCPKLRPTNSNSSNFFVSGSGLKDRCRERRIRIMGDIPIYVAHDSADVWSHPEMFLLDECGKPTVVAGVPPDYFSATGQLWGNPIYRWDVLERSGYQWWIDRFRSSFELFDLVRLDHFRGFEAYWEVPAGASTAIGGKWVKGPGRRLFRGFAE